jgi:VWFA-related protein
VNYRRYFLIAILALGLTCVLGGPDGMTYFTAYAQQAEGTSGAATTTIKAESRLVLVDVVVTDKKGNYIPDLTEKDFRVWEDDQEQKVTTFSSEQLGAAGDSQKQHLVLFFDDDSMQAVDQGRARAAASQFVEAHSGPGQYIAVIDYAGTMRVTQNFTNDSERLKKAVGTAKISLGEPTNASLGSPVFNSFASYSDRNSLLALRSVARSLASIPGRKSLIWLTDGFPLTPDMQAEMTAVINTCNKANVAVYAVDVRGLAGAVSTSGSLRATPDYTNAKLAYASSSEPVSDGSANAPHLVYVAQAKPPSGGGGGGSRPPSNTRPPSQSGPPIYTQPNWNQPRTIVPPPIPSTGVNQQVLYAIATGTGGFVIGNNNDLLAALEKIAKDQAQYYLVGYVPPDKGEGACHTLRVKVEHSGAQVRARSGYCATRPVDYLAGKPISKQLEDRAMAGQKGDISGFVATPYFYTSPETARVNLAMEIPGKTIQLEKVKGRYHGAVNILGMAIKPDGTVAARFSDTAEVDLEKGDVDDFTSHPYHYENQFYIAGGKYTLRLAVNSGDKFGTFETPLIVDHYDPSKFGISDLALSKQFYKVSDMSTALDAQLLQDRTPLVTQGLQMVPSGTNRFKTSDRVAIYLEVYEPLLAEDKTPKVGLKMRIVDEKTGKSQLEAGVPDTGSSVIPGNPVIPMGVPLPVDHLQPGNYVVELLATDSAGHESATRKAVFSVE